jgi:DNA-binding CsgD family transcriptional regulator
MQLSASRSHSGRGMNVICLVSLQCYPSQLARRQIMSTRTISIDFISNSFYPLLTKR